MIIYTRVHIVEPTLTDIVFCKRL